MQRQTELRKLLTHTRTYQQGLKLFLLQHTSLHSVQMEEADSWSFEDDIVGDMTEAQVRCVPAGSEHSIAWILWHLARCEDITMNLLVAGRPQVLLDGNWLNKLHLNQLDSGNAMACAEIEQLSNQVDISALRSYRKAVGRSTQKIVRELHPNYLSARIKPDRVQQMWDQGAVAPGAQDVGEYWASRTIAGLLLMPASRHIIIHLNEARQLKRKLTKAGQ